MSPLRSVKPRHLALLALLLASAGLAFFGDKMAPGVARSAPPLPVRPTDTAPLLPASTTQPVVGLLRPRSELAPTRRARADLFAVSKWRAALPPVKPIATELPSTSPPPFVLPPINYKVLGKKLEKGAWEVFLGHDEIIYVVRAGDTLEQQWLVERIEPPVLYVKYIPTGQLQTLNIGEWP